MLYSDGGGGHPALQGDRLQKLDALMKKGVGLACVHYATEPTIEKGEKQFLEWIGGAFEIHWSVNPHWDADFKTLPKHPVTRGVNPFKIRDEWYFHMRFRDGMKGVTAILSAVPDGSTTNRNDGTHSGNPAVREAYLHLARRWPVRIRVVQAWGTPDEVFSRIRPHLEEWITAAVAEE